MTNSKIFFGDIEVLLTWIEAKDFYNLGRQHISSCFVLPYDDKISLIENQRGIDFIGGHVDAGESYYDAMVREAKEDACIDIKSATLLGAIKVVNTNYKSSDKYPEVSYQLFYHSNVFDLHRFLPKFETKRVIQLDLSEIKNYHHNLLDVHAEMLTSLSNVFDFNFSLNEAFDKNNI